MNTTFDEVKSSSDFLNEAREKIHSNPQEALLLFRLHKFASIYAGQSRVRLKERIISYSRIAEWANTQKLPFMPDQDQAELVEPRTLASMADSWKLAFQITQNQYQQPFGVTAANDLKVFAWRQPEDPYNYFWVFSNDWHLLTENAFWLHGNRCRYAKADSVATRTLILDFSEQTNWPVADRLDEECIYLGGSSNYTHWMLDCLPSLWYAREERSRLELPVITGTLAPWQRESLAVLGHRGPTREIDTGSALMREVSISRAWVTSGVPIPTRIERMRQLLGSHSSWRSGTGPGAAAGDRVYLTRRKAGKGPRISNEQEVIEHLEARGFRIVDPESLSIQEKRELLGQARIIVTPPGSSTTNFSLFAPADAVLLLLVPDWWLRLTTLDQIMGGLLYLIKDLDRMVFAEGICNEQDRAKLTLDIPVSFSIAEIDRAIAAAEDRVKTL